MLLAVPLLASGPAAALMPPYVYENARRDAASVIVIEVRTVMPPSTPFGACRVEGRVAKVERGAAFKPGGAVALAVPCVQPGAQPPLGGTIYQPVPSLSASRYGRAWLDAAGQIVQSQYQQLERLP
ncbi:hypothetical protein V5F53_14510 [Xanthobacter sp. V4C-4]|uniref:hypothetical protein n=1 Tax=Xanthobacter cornucopiae TaxID=3119924 RepID=UPI00372CA095